MKSKNSIGFTIVELLIVIVVIAILASITIVAYSGIQGRAHDIAIQSDLRNNMQKIQIYYADKGELPSIANLTADYKLKYSGSSYNRSIYCKDAGNVVLVSVSKSGNAFKYDYSAGSVAQVSAEGAGACATYGIVSGVNPPTSINTIYNGTTWNAAVDH